MSLEDRFNNVSLDDLDNASYDMPAFMAKVFRGFIQYKEKTWYIWNEEWQKQSETSMCNFLSQQCTELLSHLVTQRMLQSFVGVRLAPNLVEQTYALKRTFDDKAYLLSVLQDLPKHLE